MKLCPYVPVDQEVVTLQSTGVAGSTTGRMILTGGVATPSVHQAQVLTNINNSGLVQNLEFVNKYSDLQTRFPDLQKVWKLKIKSGKKWEKNVSVQSYNRCEIAK